MSGRVIASARGVPLCVRKASKALLYWPLSRPLLLPILRFVRFSPAFRFIIRAIRASLLRSGSECVALVPVFHSHSHLLADRFTVSLSFARHFSPFRRILSTLFARHSLRNPAS